MKFWHSLLGYILCRVLLHGRLLPCIEIPSGDLAPCTSDDNYQHLVCQRCENCVEGTWTALIWRMRQTIYSGVVVERRKVPAHTEIVRSPSAYGHTAFTDPFPGIRQPVPATYFLRVRNKHGDERWIPVDRDSYDRAAMDLTYQAA